MYLNRKGIQFSKRDTFDYSTLSEIIVAWLEKFKEDHAKHPFAGCPSVYIDVTEQRHPTDKEIERGREQFHRDIEEMIWAFKAEEMPENCWLTEPVNNSFRGKLDWDKINSHKSRVEKGRKLFAEKFDNLWI